MNDEERLGKADVWSVSEAVDMLVGMRPIVGDPEHDPDRIKRDLRELAYGSIDARTLPCVGKAKQRMVRPADFIRWATSKGLPIPQCMGALLGVELFPETAATPASESESIKAKPEPATLHDKAPPGRKRDPATLPSKKQPGRKRSREVDLAIELLRERKATTDEDAATQAVDSIYPALKEDMKKRKIESVKRSIRNARRNPK